MGAGKGLSILAGILIIVATFVLSWFTVAGPEYAYGIGLAKNIMGMFTDAATLATSWGVETFVIYIVAVVYILFLVSGILVLIGAKVRALAIIGAIVPILLCYAIIAGALNIPPDFYPYISVFLDSEPLLTGIIPFDLPLAPANASATVSLGTYVLLAGGVLGLIGGIMGRD